MSLHQIHPVAPYLLLAELGAALFGSSAASAEERITLEIIGAVRMTAPEVICRADALPGRTEARQPHEETAERAGAPVPSHRN
jgi:hypothetical protein